MADPARETNTPMMRPRREPIDTPTPFHQLLVTVMRKKWSLLAIAVLGGILAGLAGFARPVLFEATSQVIIDAPSKPSGSLDSVLDVLGSSIDDHLTMLSSQAHLRRVLAALRKAEAANVDPQGGAGTGNSHLSLVPGDLQNTRSFTSDLLGRIWPQSAAVQKPEAADVNELKALRNGMRVGQELRSRVITIGFTDVDPVRAALVANTISQVYIDDLAQKRRASDQQELNSIIAGLPRVQSDLVDATDRLETYRLTHGGVDQGAADNAAKETAELSRQISLSKADLSATQSRLQHIQDLRREGATISTLAEAVGSPVLADLVGHDQANAVANENPSNSINREIEQATARLAAEASIYQAQVASLEERKSVLDAVISDTASQLSGLRALEPQVSIVTQRYNELLSRQQDLIRRIANPSPGVSILSAAWPPSNPKTLSRLFLIPPGMIVFGLVGAVFIIVRTGLNQTLRSEAEAEAALGVPCVGLLPKLPRVHAKQLRQLVLGRPNSMFSRAVMSLLVTAAPPQPNGRPPHIILVTSSVADEGKTELAWSLALAATRLGGKVLLLDLDSKDVRLTNRFLDEFGTGTPHNSFADFVSDRCALRDAIARMPEIGIDFMAAPSPSDDLLTLLSRADSSQFTDELRSIYSVVVINGPLGLGGPETRILTYWADGVLFAVRWGKTRRSIARVVVEPLQARGSAAVPVGCVLTRVNLRKYAGYRFGDSADLLLVRG